MKMDSQNQANRIQKEFDGEVEHVSGNMFRVKREIINFAKAGITSVDGKFVYGNPRWFINRDGKPEAKGIDRSKMEELKNSIKDRGVDHPIRLRVAEDPNSGLFLEVVNGERRLRAIEELCDSGKDCWDVSSGSSKSASEVYEWVECRVEFMDDATALCCALQLNETSEIIGDAANINVVKVLRESGYDDQEILKATGKSLSWLREIDQLIGLDEVCLQNYQSEAINKRVALRLSLIKDVEERVAKLEQIKRVAEERHLEKVRQSREKFEEAVKEAHEAEMDEHSHNIEMAGDGEEPSDSSSKSKARKNAKKKMEKAKEELNKTSSGKVTAKSKDADAVEGSSKPLSHSKISSKLLRPLQEIIENDGSCDDGEFDVSSLMLIQAILEAILSGNSDLIAILEEHCSSYGEASDEDEIEASDEDEIEASDEDEIEASDEDEDEDEDEDDYEDENSYTEALDSEEMVADLEKEFEQELRAMDRDY